MEGALCDALSRDCALIETFFWSPETGVRDGAAHWARLRRSAAALGFPLDAAALFATLESLEGVVPLRARLTLARDGALSLTTAPLTPTQGPWRVGVSPERLEAEALWLRHKTTDRGLYDRTRATLPRGLDEMLFLNERDELCEGTITNVFLRFDHGPLHTPPLSSGCLPGVLRQRLLESGEARERVLPRQALLECEGLWVGNALRGLIPAVLAEDFERPLQGPLGAS